MPIGLHPGAAGRKQCGCQNQTGWEYTLQMGRLTPPKLGQHGKILGIEMYLAVDWVEGGHRIPDNMAG
jgi:hypothetical protein